MKLTLLFGDYTSISSEFVPICSDTDDVYADSLWYHFAPGNYECQKKISAEENAISQAAENINLKENQISLADHERRFITTRAVMTPVEKAPTLYPEYDKLWGFTDSLDKDRLVVYSFFGVDSDINSSSDYGMKEYMRYIRTILTQFPEFKVKRTKPHSSLLDYSVGGTKLENISFVDIAEWIVDDSGYPAEISGNDAEKALKNSVTQKFKERFIYWELPVTISDSNITKEMIVELRTYYGEEDGSHEAREHARWRYLEAFWHGDIFSYTGHSHFGHGPLRPDTYNSSNFADRYQVMLINSCLSFNYYDKDFLNMHPGGSEKLDVVVNGLPAYWYGMGESTAKYILGLIDGKQKSWLEILKSMRVRVPWSYSSYDPMRAVNGELDNVYSPVDSSLSLEINEENDSYERTVVFIYGETSPGQDMFIRGGIDHSYAASQGVECSEENKLCAIPMRHLNWRNETTANWKEGDNFLDWYGSEESQGLESEGTPLDWTTNYWPESWGDTKNYDEVGFGVTELNSYGTHYWMLDVEMDCSKTALGWFEVKSYISNGPGWESDIIQPGAPYSTNNHFAKCGMINSFSRNQNNPVEIREFN